MMRVLLLAVSCTGLVACANPLGLVGGPCSYDTQAMDVKIVSVVDRGVLVDSGDDQFYVARDDLNAPPEPGETITLERKKITQGACVPVMYRQVSAPA